jgi:hypothetical protein|tara:strand:- start:1965 stop:2255 length:291 start_codon:yes stop_codon:yes gene_type:complete
MANKIIKNNKVTRAQYDKLQVEVVNRIEELEAKEAYDSKGIRGQVARANTRLYAEIRTLQERQAELEKKANTLLIGLMITAAAASGMSIAVAWFLS